MRSTTTTQARSAAARSSPLVLSAQTLLGSLTRRPPTRVSGAAGAAGRVRPGDDEGRAEGRARHSDLRHLPQPGALQPPPARRPHPCAPRSPRSVERSKWWLDQRPLRAAPDSRRLSARPALPPLAACRLPPALLPLAQPLWLTSCVACPAPTGLKRLIITLIHTHVSAQAVLSFFAVQSGEMAAEPPRLTFAVVEGGSGGFAVRSAQHTSSGSWP